MAALLPPNPEIIFTKDGWLLATAWDEILIRPDTPISLKPMVGSSVPCSMECMVMMVSRMPEAPSVCPRAPFRVLAGMADSPEASMALDSIWSLYMVAVPWTLTAPNVVLSIPSVTY